MPRPGLAANSAELNLGGSAAGTANIDCSCSSQLIGLAGHMGREGFGICDQSTTFSGLTLPLTASVEAICGGACVHKLEFISQAASKLGIFLTTILRGMEEDRTVKGFFYS